MGVGERRTCGIDRSDFVESVMNLGPLVLLLANRKLHQPKNLANTAKQLAFTRYDELTSTASSMAQIVFLRAGCCEYSARYPKLFQKREKREEGRQDLSTSWQAISTYLGNLHDANRYLKKSLLIQAKKNWTTDAKLFEQAARLITWREAASVINLTSGVPTVVLDVDEFKRAFRRRQKIYHEDKHPNVPKFVKDQLKRESQAINLAYAEIKAGKL